MDGAHVFGSGWGEGWFGHDHDLCFMTIVINVEMILSGPE
jgi:hypothetical protein